MRTRERWAFLTVAAVLVVVLPALNALPAGSPLRVSDFTLNLFGKFLTYAILALGIGWMNTLFELVTDSAVMGKVLILVVVILFLQRRPSGLFPPTGRSVEY